MPDAFLLSAARTPLGKYLGALAPYAGHTWWALSREACEHILDSFHLIRDLRDVGGTKTLAFVAVRHVEFALPIEPHHTIEARSIQKQKIK